MDLKSPIGGSGGKSSPSKNIEIYATLPKNKKGLLSRSSTKAKSNVVEDEEYIMKERPGRSLLSTRSKSSKKEIEKRTRSEERNPKSKEPVVVPAAKEKEKDKEASKKQKQEEKQNKKQHKIRRKLLMGGLMRRKNRSMPDLREDEGLAKDTRTETPPKEVSKDDSMVSSKTAIQPNLSGYLSEGNLEYTGNPNLERSKLMRKSFHSKILSFNKVPPPPPLRTTSQLSKTDQRYSPPVAESLQRKHGESDRSWCQEPTSLPYMPRTYDAEKSKTDAITYSNGGFLLNQNSMNTVVTEAQIHHEASFQSLPPSVDEPDFVSVASKADDLNFQLPPYPSPIHSTVHSRQASEDFPPPPSGLPLPPEVKEESSFLTMLQEKRDKLLNSSTKATTESNEVAPESKRSSSGGESWLRELQAKQAERRKVVEHQNEIRPCTPPELKNNFRDLKSKFEHLHVASSEEAHSAPLSLANGARISPSIAKPADICEEGSREAKRKTGKKKNVTFCEQVVLVATADDDESDSYIPNPILERVLRTVLHKESKDTESREHAVHSVVPLKRTDSYRLAKGLPLKPYAADTNGLDTQKEAAKAIQNSMKMAAELSSGKSNGTQNNAPTDEVDTPSYSYENRARQTTNYNTYSPTYIPASSLCPPPAKANETYRNDYPEPTSLQNESSSHSSHNEYPNNDYYGTEHNENYSHHNGRSYQNAQENVRYSPETQQPTQTQNGYNSQYNHQCSPYQSVPSPTSYQPMSLQYYPSQSVRSNPQSYRDGKPSQYVNGCHPSSSSLVRQNSNVSHYINSRQVSPQSPRRVPMAVNSSPQNTVQRSQKPYVNGVSPYQPVPNANTNAYSNGYQNTTQPASSSPSYDSVTRTSASGISPYQSVPHSAEQPKLSNSSPYQHVPYNAANGNSSNYYKGSPTQRSNYLPPVYQHPPPPPTSNAYQHMPATNSPSSVYHQHSPQSSVYQSPPHPTGNSANSYQHPPHPVNSLPNTQSSTYQYPPHPTASSTTSTQSTSVYQHPPHPSANSTNTQSSVYQHPPHPTANSLNTQSSAVYQHSSHSVATNSHSTAANLPNSQPMYQHTPHCNGGSPSTLHPRVPTPNQQNRVPSAGEFNNLQQSMKYSPYQHLPTTSKRVPERITSGAATGGSHLVPCNLCRKKQITPPSVYCRDCDFYISRFKEKT